MLLSTRKRKGYKSCKKRVSAQKTIIPAFVTPISACMRFNIVHLVLTVIQYTLESGVPILMQKSGLSDMKLFLSLHGLTTEPIWLHRTSQVSDVCPLAVRVSGSSIWKLEKVMV